MSGQIVVNVVVKTASVIVLTAAASMYAGLAIANIESLLRDFGVSK
jgi:hypothetical protein